jgi:hypothetical protein
MGRSPLNFLIQFSSSNCSVFIGALVSCAAGLARERSGGCTRSEDEINDGQDVHGFSVREVGEKTDCLRAMRCDQVAG